MLRRSSEGGGDMKREEKVREVFEYSCLLVASGTCAKGLKPGAAPLPHHSRARQRDFLVY